MEQKKLTIVLAAGGTGGHVFPAKSLAEALQAKGYEAILITDKRTAAYGKFDGMEVNVIPAAGSGKGIIGKLLNALKIVLGMAKASYYLHMASPDVVVGFGGYPSFPTMMAATKRGHKTIIHEQNSVLGRVNKYLARSVNAVATAFDQVSGVSNANRDKVTLTGNPVRAAVKAIAEKPYPAMEDGIHILVTGGSQGASVFAEVVPEALENLPSGFKDALHIDQQCRKDDVDKVKHYYQQSGIKAHVAAFFDDMPERLARAHLVICRAGASTLAEITVAGRPAILVPYPFAMDDHQTTNAKAVEVTGGAWVVDEKELTAEWLKEKLEQLLSQPDTLISAAEKIKTAGHPDASGKLLALVEKVAAS